MSYEMSKLSLDFAMPGGLFPVAHHRFCDYTNYNTWIWADYLSASLKESQGIRVLFRRMMDGTPTYTALCDNPLSDDNIRKLMALAQAEGNSLCLFPLSAEEKEKLLADYHGTGTTSQDFGDYLYHLEDLAGFRGKKFNGQRNHLNRFRALYPTGTCVKICDIERKMVLDFLDKFYAETPLSPPVLSEKEKITRLVKDAPFDGHDGLFGCAVTVEQQVVAMAIGEVVGDTLYIHSEKALRTYRGAYQAMVVGFASRFLGQGVLYVNREEDDGNPGLRTSKLSYHPAAVLEKWAVTIPFPSNLE